MPMSFPKSRCNCLKRCWRRISVLCLLTVIISLSACVDDGFSYVGETVNILDLYDYEQSDTEICSDKESTFDTIETLDAESDITVVFWVASGKVWHTKSDCVAISKSAFIESGSLTSAIEAGKERVCKRCGE